MIFFLELFFLLFFFIKKAATIEGERKKQKASIKSNTLDSEESSTLLTTCCFRLQEYDIVCSFFFSSYNEFIRCFHQFVSPIFCKKFSQVEELKRKTNSFFLSLLVEKEIIIVDSEFGIGETI